MASTQTPLTELCPFTGAQYTSTVTTASGSAALLMNGSRLPFGFRLLSDRFAIQGSVTASNTRPSA